MFDIPELSPSRDVRRHQPPVVDLTKLALINQLSLRRLPTAMTMGDAVIAFTPIGLGSIDTVMTPSECMIFRFTVDGQRVALQMASGLYERILARIDPELLAADLDGEILPLLLESCIGDGLTAAETRLGGRIELSAVEPGAVLDLEGLDVALEIAIDGETAGVAALRAAHGDVKRLADLFATRSAMLRPYGDLKTELSFRAGALWLDLGMLRALKAGDVLLVEEDASRWERMAATVGEHWLIPIEMTRTGPTAEAPFRRADTRDQEEWMMADYSQADDHGEALSDLLKSVPKHQATSPREETGTHLPPGAATGDADEPATDNIDASPAAPPTDAAFDDLPIKLVFELGRLDMPLGQLQEIGRGHVFQLERPLGEAVEIHAGGRRIGQGEVVRIDDQIGVRVIRLFGQSGA
ncbi:MAG: type III secretion system cytoplasmic ring protein SctQ [Geminicoccaceae bacterium]